MNRSPIVATLLAVVPLILAGCSGPPVNSTGSTTKAVAMENAYFVPEMLNVEVGTTVVWTNKDPVTHTVTPTDPDLWGSAGSGTDRAQWLKKGETWSFTFTKSGTFKYYCIPHASDDGHGNFNGMVGTVIVAGSGTTSSNVTERAVPDARAPAPTGRSTPATVPITLETQEKVAQLADGVSYEFWTFNGTVPGPMLRVRQGDTVELTLKNSAASQHPHSIDLHAVTGPGGGAKATQTSPGEESKIWFQALNPGLYVYHCATPHVPTHVANGMYGLILVEPPEGLPTVDREYFVVQGEIYTEGKVGEGGRQEFSAQKMMDERAEYYLFNGRVGALTGSGALTANVNETVRLYVGVGGFVPSNFHVIGEIFDKVYPEGSLSSPMLNVQTTLIPAGGSAVVEFKVEVPGDYLLVDHWLTHAIDRGAVGILSVKGPENPTVFHPGIQ